MVRKIQQEPKETSIRGTMKTYVVPLVKFAVQKPEHVNSGDQSPFYNIIEMEVTTQIKPCYYVFHTVPAQNFQNPYQNFLSPQPTLIWTYQFNSTTSNLEQAWPQKAQTPTAAFQPTQNSLILPQPAIKEASKRNQRRTKNKRLRNSKKELESAKKNSQSNIVNQLFSFFNSYEKSQSVVEKAIVRMRKNIDDVDRIKAIFYNIVRLINYKRGRNYVNKQNILNYYTPQGFIKNIPDIEFKLGQIQLLTLEELCLLFRVATSYFIRNISMSAILTSKRISMIAKNEHLKRRRRVYASLCEKNP